MNDFIRTFEVDVELVDGKDIGAVLGELQQTRGLAFSVVSSGPDGSGKHRIRYGLRSFGQAPNFTNFLDGSDASQYFKSVDRLPS